jgi:AcrR family transcriptional regulator
VNAETRAYRQSARAAAAAANTGRILDAAEALFSERLYDQVTLEDVARSAGVGLQTLIRRYPTKEALVRGVADAVSARVLEQRSHAPTGDVQGIVRNLADHYEATGDVTLKVLSQEGRVLAFREATERGRRVHREWVERVFADRLEALRPAERELRTVQLIAICDVYAWKVMRRDQGLTRARYERALEQLIEGLGGES